MDHSSLLNQIMTLSHCQDSNGRKVSGDSRLEIIQSVPLKDLGSYKLNLIKESSFQVRLFGVMFVLMLKLRILIAILKLPSKMDKKQVAKLMVY